MSPVKHLQTQIDNGGIQANQFVLKAKPLLPDIALRLAPIKKFQKDILIKFPGTMFVGVSQSGMTGSTDAKVFELAFATAETAANLAEGIGPPQLTEQHGYKLAPGGEPPGMTFGFGFFDHLLELQTRKQL